MGNERAPELAEVIRNALEARIAHINVSLPARIESYDATTQKANVKPLVMMFYRDEEDERQVEPMPVITAVPVAFPSGGGYCLTFPLKQGDIGTIVWSQLSLDAWLAGHGQEVDPEVDHLHGLSDGIFIPGLRPFGAPLPDVPSDHAALGANGGVRIHLRGDQICIGDESGSDAIALAGPVNAALAALKAVIATRSGPPITPYTLPDVSAEQAKAK